MSFLASTHVGSTDDGGTPTTETMLEDWESGSIGSEWTVDSSGFTVESNSSLNGSYNLVQSGGSFARLWSYEGDGLPEYVSRGDSIEFISWTNTEDDFVSGIYFGVVDASNNYFTRKQGTDFQLVEKVGGSNSPIGAQSATMPANTPIKWRVDWYDGSGGRTAGDMDLTVTDMDADTELVSISTNSTNVEDNTGENGTGVGVWYQANNTNRFDDILKISEDDSGDTTVTTVDGFEDENFDEWSGDTGSYVFNTSGAQEGNVWIQPNQDSYAQMTSVSGLNAYPEQGDEFAIYTYVGSGSASNTYTAPVWGVQSLGQTTYYARPRAGSNELELVLAGTNYTTSVTVNEDTWYNLRIQWDDGSTFGGSVGDMTAYLEDLNGNVLATVGPQNNNEYASGGVGIGIVNAGGADHYRILNR